MKVIKLLNIYSLQIFLEISIIIISRQIQKKRNKNSLTPFLNLRRNAEHVWKDYYLLEIQRGGYFYWLLMDVGDIYGGME